MQSLLGQRGLVMVVTDTPTGILRKASPQVECWMYVGLFQRIKTQKSLRKMCTWGEEMGDTKHREIGPRRVRELVFVCFF